MTKKEIERIAIDARKTLRLKAREEKLRKDAEKRANNIRIKFFRDKKQEDEELLKKLKDEDTQITSDIRFCKQFKVVEHFHEDVIKLTREGWPVENIIKGVFFDERNPPYDLSGLAKYQYDLPIKGNVNEHFNGRTMIGVYEKWAYLIGDIKNPQDLEAFYKIYCMQIKTDKDFNNDLRQFQNEEGAIKAEIYISKYEEYFNTKLDSEKRENFASKFLETKYGCITKKMVIHYILKNKLKITDKIFFLFR